MSSLPRSTASAADPTTWMSATAHSATPSEDRQLDDAVASLGARAADLCRMTAADKAALLRACIPRIHEAAAAWVAEGCKAKGLAMADAGEEWLAGPMPTIRMARLLVDSLEQIAKDGRPQLGMGSRVRSDGRLEIDLAPASRLDGVMFAGFSGKVLMEAGLDRDAVLERQAKIHRDPSFAGGVSLVLGAGNVSSIPPMDVFTKMFIDGFVCLLKMNPVNEWVGPYLERALAPLIAKGFLRIVYGGAEAGRHLVEHAGIADVHITGSDKTHDLIVWGPPGPERDRRMAANDPKLKVPITSELGNVSPVAIVPYTYSDDELAFQARNVVSMVANNVSFNCNAAKMILTSKDWAQRDKFFALVERGLGSLKPRKAYYPGAFDRYDTLVAGRKDVRTFGARSQDVLPWTFLRNIDSGDPNEILFSTEPFCPIVSETTIGSADPVEFLDRATAFMNDRLWGTLNACVVIHPDAEADVTIGRALDRAITELRYGTVAINHWPALCYGFGTMPWGGHPSATLKDIQSGLGWVHNTFMLGGIEKAIVRGALKVRPNPVWFFDNTKTTAMGPKMVAMEANPSWLKLPGLLLKAL